MGSAPKNNHYMGTLKQLEAKRVWEKANPDKVKEMARRSYLKHKEKRNAEAKAWYEKNKEKALEYSRKYNKAWYQRNKENRSAQMKVYAEAHRGDSVRRTQKYVAKNKEKVYEYGREYNKTSAGAYRVYKSTAATKGKEFPLSVEEFAAIVLLSCVYCGEDSKRIGIDRIDNTKGYIKENCAPCCKNCNYMKKNLTVQDFLAHIAKIYKHNEKNQYRGA